MKIDKNAAQQKLSVGKMILIINQNWESAKIFNQKAVEQLIIDSMNSDISLKRNIYAESIRINQRDRIRRNLRRQLQQFMAHPHPDYTFDTEHFMTLKKQCRQQGFNQENVNRVLEYVFPKNDNITRIAEGPTMKFFDQIINNFLREGNQTYERQIIAPWKEQILKKIKHHLETLIKTELSNPNLGDWSKNSKKKIPQQFGSLYILHNCFAEFLQLVLHYDIFMEFWHQISLVYNAGFKVIAFQNFVILCEHRLNDMPAEQLAIVIKSLANFLEDAPTKLVPGALGIINEILKEYRLGQQDFDAIMQSLLLVLNSEGHSMEATIQTMNNETEIIPNVLDYLANRQYVCYEGVKKIALFIAKVFFANERICKEIYQKNDRVMNLLRMWLPVEGKVTSQQVQDALTKPNYPIKLSHSNHSCTNCLIYSFSNIVATGESYAAKFLSSDGFLALEYLYKALPLLCKRQICSVFYNMIAIADDPSIPSIMLSFGFVNVLQDMLDNQDEQILVKGMKIVALICRMLPVEKSSTQYLLPTSTQFVDDLISRGCRSTIQGLLCNINQQVGELGEKVIQIMDSIVPTNR